MVMRLSGADFGPEGFINAPNFEFLVETISKSGLVMNTVNLFQKLRIDL